MDKHDLVIRNGMVIDGTGDEPRRADVAVRDGLIVEVGEVAGRGREEIDALGQLVTPGFVDVHTHYDGQATWENRLVPSTNHGVTTVVMGNCGVGFAPCKPEDRDVLIKLMEGVEDIPNVVLKEGVDWQWTTYPGYLDHLSGREFDADVCSYVPHAALRTYVMGERAYAREPATADEIEQMAAILEEAVRAGAFGFGTSQTMFHRSSDGQPIPTLAATEEEYAGLAGALERAGGGLVQLVIEYDDDWEQVLDMGLRQAAASGRPFSMSLVQSHGNPLIWRRILAKFDAHNAAGGTATIQVLPRPLGVLLGLELTLNPFYSTPSYLALADLPLVERVRELRRPEVKARILAETNDPDPTIEIGLRVRDFAQLYEMGAGFDYEPARDSSIGAQAEGLGVSAESVAYDKLLEGEGSNILYLAFSNYADFTLEPTRQMLLNDHAVPGLGDGGAHLGVICDGSIYTHLLTHWGRDRTQGDRLPLPYLIHTMTKRCAEMVGLEDRGVVAPGYRADLNVIDLAALSLGLPRVVRDLPAGGRRLMQDAHGYTATVVAGTVVTRDGLHTGALPGRLVRGPQAAPPALVVRTAPITRKENTMNPTLTPVGGRSAWLGSTLDYRQDGLWQLSATELAEIDAALAVLKDLGDLDLVDITPTTFPLDTVGGLLARLRDELASGRGFVLIRGLSREMYDDDDLARIYVGLGAHLGEVIPQSGNGEVLGHVMNVADLVDEQVRGYRSAQSMNMHCDGHDVVSLLCLRAAKSGGASRIASAAAVHDRMVATAPELARVLYDGMPVMRGQMDADNGDGKVVTSDNVALFTTTDGTFSSCVHVAQTRDAARAGHFEITAEQEAALDLFCELAASPEFYLDMDIAPGDIQFLNNRLIVHGRAPYEDHEPVDQRRHLMRLWVNIPSWPRRPATQQDIYSMADLPLWARFRTPFMEMPGRYLGSVKEKQQDLLASRG